MEKDTGTKKDHPFHFTGQAVNLFILFFTIICSPSDILAGEYHSYRNGTLYCADCHRVSRAEEIDPGEPESGNITDSYYGSRSNDLSARPDNRVCTNCHDNDPDYSDVVGVNTGLSPGIVREAGALNTIGGGYPYSEGNGHTLGSIDPAPGSSPMWIANNGLMCVDCHDPHGENPNGNAYRNLTALPGYTPYPGTVVTYSTGINDHARDVFVRDPSTYDISNVDFNEPLPGHSAISEFCRGCHTEFHGSKGGIEVGGATGVAWIRHPSGGADIGWAGERYSSRKIFAGEWMEKDNYVKVMTSTGNWTPGSAQEVTDHSPTCLSCHKAHGNMNPFGLIFMGNRGPISEEGTTGGKYIDLCRQCHIQSILWSQLTRR